MTDSLETGLAKLTNTFAERLRDVLSQDRWRRLQMLIDQVNEIDPGRYELDLAHIDFKAGKVGIRVIDLKQSYNDGKSYQPFSMFSSANEYMEARKQGLNFTPFSPDNKSLSGSPAPDYFNEVDFIVSKLPDALPEDIYQAYADKFLSADGQHPGFNL